MIFDCLFISLKVTSQLLTLFVCMSGFSSRLIISHLHRWYGGGALKPVRDAFLSVFCWHLSLCQCFWLFESAGSPHLSLTTLFSLASFSRKKNQLFRWSLDKYQNMATQQTAEPLYKCTSYPPHPFPPHRSFTLLLAGLSIHNWTFPLLSPIGVTDNAASMFFGAWWREIEHCLM